MITQLSVHSFQIDILAQSRITLVRVQDVNY